MGGNSDLDWGVSEFVKQTFVLYVISSLFSVPIFPPCWSTEEKC